MSQTRRVLNGFLNNRSTVDSLKRGALIAVAIAWMPALWIFIKYGLGVSDRYFPDPLAVIESIPRLSTALVLHSATSLARLTIGYILSCVAGLVLGIYMYKFRPLEEIFAPALQALRAVPSTATVPFFILWFGFAEQGKILIIVMGLSLNLAIAVLQVLHNIPEKYKIAFRGYQKDPRNLPIKILVPFALESLLPTLRFSLTVAIGLVVVAEYLGAQSGLGYLIQSARTTYSFEVLLLAAAIFGMITWAMDRTIQTLWSKLVPWRQRQ